MRKFIMGKWEATLEELLDEYGNYKLTIVDSETKAKKELIVSEAEAYEEIAWCCEVCL